MQPKTYLKKLLPVLFCFKIMSNGTVSAQSQLSLPLDEAINMAIKHSWQLQADSTNIQITDTKILQNKNDQLPQVSANLSYIRISDNITPFTVAFPTGQVVLNPQILNQSYNSIQARQLIWAGGKVKYAGELSVLEKKVVAFDLEKNRAEVGYAAAALWYNLFAATQSKKIIEANVALLANQKKDAENLVNGGILLGNELLKIELALTSLESNLADINSSINLLQYNLCVVTGIDTKTLIDLPGTLPVATEQSLLLDDYVQTAVANRAELKALSVRKEQSNTMLKLSKSSYNPILSAGGSYNYDQPNQRLFPNQATFTGTWNIGVFLSWSLTDLYTTKYKVTEAKLSSIKLNAFTQQIKEGIQIEVNADYNNYQQAKQKIIIAKKTVEQATENFRVEQNKFQNSTSTSTDFLNANTQLLQANLNLSTAAANAELAYRRLLKSTNSK